MTRCASDIGEVLAAHFPGIVVQRNLTDAIAIWLAEHGCVSDGDVPAILAAANSLGPPAYPLSPVPYPTAMPRWLNSNEASDGWSILDDEKAVRAASPAHEHHEPG